MQLFFKFQYHAAHLIMNHARYGAGHGVPLDRIWELVEYTPPDESDDHEWSTLYEVGITEGELYVVASHDVFLSWKQG